MSAINAVVYSLNKKIIKKRKKTKEGERDLDFFEECDSKSLQMHSFIDKRKSHVH